jgi:hypothetical protein
VVSPEKHCQLTWRLAFEIVSSRPNYSAYTNSCQNFVIYLVEYVCPGLVVTPKTFKEAVDGLILEWSISQTRMRNPDQSFASIEGTIFDLRSMLTQVEPTTFGET